MSVIPPKLQPGDLIRVVSPSTSLGVISADLRQIAMDNLGEMGLAVSFARNAEELDEFGSSSISSRVEDLHASFADPVVKGILTTLGGYNCNQLLRYLDYELIQANPKVFCGYSDITALATAIYVKTGLVTYSGPHFSTFGMKKGLEYTRDHFRKCLIEAGLFPVEPSSEWSDDAWYRDQEDRNFIRNEGYWIINPGQAEGTLIGGNLCTLNLLQGTDYMATLIGSILLVEDDFESKPLTFDRDLQSLLHQPGFRAVQGLIIGRFQKESAMDREKLVKLIRSKQELKDMPVVANVDIGHTTPQLTFPIGGKGKLIVESSKVTFIISEH